MKELRIPVGEARKNMRNILRRAAKGARVKLTRYNRTMAVIISRDDLLQLQDCDGASNSATRRASASGGRTRG